MFTNSPDVRAQEVNIVLDFNNEDDIQSEALISSLTRVTSKSEVPAVKFLGIFIDPALNFKFHLQSICSKVSKSMFFLRSVKKFLPAPALKSIYYAIIHSHFVYGIQIWSCTSPSNLNALIIKQKAAVRIVNTVIPLIILIQNQSSNLSAFFHWITLLSILNYSSCLVF